MLDFISFVYIFISQFQNLHEDKLLHGLDIQSRRFLEHAQECVFKYLLYKFVAEHFFRLMYFKLAKHKKMVTHFIFKGVLLIRLNLFVKKRN